VLQWVVIPCCIGLGQTKTLAKLANHVAKTAERKPGSYPPELSQICNLAAMDRASLEAVLTATAVDEVWGVGRRIAAQLKEGGIHTVLDLARMDLGTVRQRWSVVLERTVRELQGQPCVGLEDAAPDKQEIACTRSFGQTVSALGDLSEAVSEFASRAAEKLRRQDGQANQVLTFVRTSPFRDDPQYSRSIVVPLRRPTSDTSRIVEAALAGLHCIYKPDFLYAKAGVMLLELQPASVHQNELDLEPDNERGNGRKNERDKGRLMGALDGLNRRYGRGTVLLGSTGLQGERRRWAMKQERRTPQYTTRWEDMPVVRA
jgi:DNA polymerase V